MNEEKVWTPEDIALMLFADIHALMTQLATVNREYERNKIRLTMKSGQRFTLTVEEEK